MFSLSPNFDGSLFPSHVPRCFPFLYPQCLAECLTYIYTNNHEGNDYNIAPQNLHSTDKAIYGYVKHWNGIYITLRGTFTVSCCVFEEEKGIRKTVEH